MAIEQLLTEPVIDLLVSVMSGPGFCGAESDPERCVEVVTALLPRAIPILVEAADLDRIPVVCNQAVPDTCPA